MESTLDVLEQVVGKASARPQLDAKVRQALKLRDVDDSTTLASTFTCTSAFLSKPLGLDGDLNNAIDKIVNLENRTIAGSRVGVTLLYAVPGYGKTVFCQELYRKLREDEEYVPLYVTLNDWADVRLEISSSASPNFDTVLAKRVAFSFFVNHSALELKSDDNDEIRRVRKLAFRTFSNVWNTVAETTPSMPSLSELIGVVDKITGSRKQIVLLLDETTMVEDEQYAQLFDTVKDGAAVMLPPVQGGEGDSGWPVSTFLVGARLAALREKINLGFLDAKRKGSPTVYDWLILQPACTDDKDLATLEDFMGSQVRELLRRSQYSDADIEQLETRIGGFADFLVALGNRHWRTYEHLVTGGMAKVTYLHSVQ